jgi:hypothetical protein
MEDSSTAIYREAKSEYTKQLIFNFLPVLLRFFIERFNEATDLWFHLDNYPSCHIIASVPEYVSREQIKRIIKHGVRLSKEHSRHGQDVNVIYRRVYLVSKCQKEGEVVVNM